MFKRIIIALILLTSAMAFGQGYRYDNIALLDTGRPANSATILVCSSGSTGTPCTPTASIFSNSGLSVSLGNPFTSDTLGNYGFYAACNKYDVQISGSGLTTRTMKDVQIGPCNPGGTGAIAGSSVAANGGGASFIAAPPSYIDGSSQTGGTGGMVQFTNDPSNVTGYSGWLTNNAFWNGTNWIQPRGVGTSSTGLAVSHHKSFSFNRAAATGTNNSIFNWTEIANLDSSGNFSIAGQYKIAGVQIAASNLSNGVTGSGPVVLATSPSLTTPAIGSAGATFAGSTSGTLTLKAAAAASGTITIPAINDQMVTRTSTDTLTNKTLGGTTPYNRFIANQGTAVTAAKFAASAGFGSTASFSAVAGTDSAFTFTVTSSGTGQAGNPTVTFTFADGAWTNTPICVPAYANTGAPITAWGISSTTTTTLVLIFPNTPVAANAYAVFVICQGK